MLVKSVSIGELLYDVFPDGERLGGAPSNFAYHLESQGGASSLVSAVGDDPRGTSAIDSLRESGVDVGGVTTVADKPTGSVVVELKDGHPSYDIIQDVAWDHIDLTADTASSAREADLLCWGTLGQRSCRSLQAHRQLFDLVPDTCLRVCDINFRMHFHSEEVVVDSLKRADLLKLNDEEVQKLRGYVGGFAQNREFLRELRHRFEIQTIVLTLGSAGCRVSAHNTDFKAPGLEVDVVNTVGSGDAFTAAFVMKMLNGADLWDCAWHANRVGAYVATQDSGMPTMPDEYRVVH